MPKMMLVMAVASERDLAVVAAEQTEDSSSDQSSPLPLAHADAQKK
jgi:hypothetical protein